MAVYKRTFTTYAGPLTDERLRFTILTRYAFRTVFESKATFSFLTACFFPHLIALVFIYLRNNLDALAALDPNLPLAQMVEFFSVDGRFFARLLTVESWLTFIAIAMVGPGLVAPDLANNALPIYLSRPFSRREYVAGKLATLAILASLITWIPALLLVVIQLSLAGSSWLSESPRIVMGILAGSWIWIVTISLVALAISAWVKWKPVAVGALFGVFFAGAALGETTNLVLFLDPRWGTLLNLRLTMTMLWEWLLIGDSVFHGAGGTHGIPAWTGLASMLLLCGLSLGLLAWKIRASEVVRG